NEFSRKVLSLNNSIKTYNESFTSNTKEANQNNFNEIVRNAGSIINSGQSSSDNFTKNVSEFVDNSKNSNYENIQELVRNISSVINDKNVLLNVSNAEFKNEFHNLSQFATSLKTFNESFVEANQNKILNSDNSEKNNLQFIKSTEEFWQTISEVINF